MRGGDSPTSTASNPHKVSNRSGDCARRTHSRSRFDFGIQPSFCLRAHVHNFLGIDSFSILFDHCSFQQLARFPRFLGGFLERRILGKNGEDTPRNLQAYPAKKTMLRHTTRGLNHGFSLTSKLRPAQQLFEQTCVACIVATRR